MATQITESNFEDEVLRSSLPVLADFWATWCGPCKMISPIIDQISKEFEGKAKVVKIDVDACPNLAQRYGVRSIPTLLFMKGGAVVETIVGATSKDIIVSRLKACIEG